jgi:hypothetical protein
MTIPTFDYDDALLEAWLAVEVTSVYDKSVLEAAKVFARASVQVQLERVAQEEHQSGSYTVAKKLRERAAKLAEIINLDTEKL